MDLSEVVYGLVYRGSNGNEHRQEVTCGGVKKLMPHRSLTRAIAHVEDPGTKEYQELWGFRKVEIVSYDPRAENPRGTEQIVETITLIGVEVEVEPDKL